MFHVGCKFTKLDYVYEIMKTTSYYKMNDFQVHLNNNSFLEFYKDADEALAKGYPGFRLESELEDNNHTLTSTDRFYTKAEFTKFIADSAKYGVTIVPEFDTPGHALSFVKIRTDLIFKGEILNAKVDQERAAMLNLVNNTEIKLTRSTTKEFKTFFRWISNSFRIKFNRINYNF